MDFPTRSISRLARDMPGVELSVGVPVHFIHRSPEKDVLESFTGDQSRSGFAISQLDVEPVLLVLLCFL